MSASPQKTDIRQRARDVRFGPIAEVERDIHANEKPGALGMTKFVDNFRISIAPGCSNWLVADFKRMLSAIRSSPILGNLLYGS